MHHQQSATFFCPVALNRRGVQAGTRALVRHTLAQSAITWRGRSTFITSATGDKFCWDGAKKKGETAHLNPKPSPFLSPIVSDCAPKGCGLLFSFLSLFYLSVLSAFACSFEVTVTSVSLPPFVSRRGLSNTNQRLSPVNIITTLTQTIISLSGPVRVGQPLKHDGGRVLLSTERVIGHQSL